MTGTTERLDEQFTKARELAKATNIAIEALIAEARQAEPTPVILEISQWIGVDGQARDGQLIQILAEAERMKTHRGGLDTWITTHLDHTPGAARGLAQAAREIGSIPDLYQTLTWGEIGASSIRTLTRAADAVDKTEQDLTTALAETLEIATGKGVAEANRHVRILEETVDPGHAEKLLKKQRKRSLLRFIDCESGMVRTEALLDPERATTFQAAVDLTIAAILRARQYDKTELVPDDVRSVEQLQAHALVRFAEVFLDATPEQRGASFTAPTLYSAKLDPAEDAALAESVHGRLIPRSRLAPPKNPATHLIEHIDGQPVRLDGENLDQNPTARLATPQQRTALAWRDKNCTYPGCTRPPTWSLHAHHKIPFGLEGPTTMENLKLLCTQHHTQIHHPGT